MQRLPAGPNLSPILLATPFIVLIKCNDRLPLIQTESATFCSSLIRSPMSTITHLQNDTASWRPATAITWEICVPKTTRHLIRTFVPSPTTTKACHDLIVFFYRLIGFLLWVFGVYVVLLERVQFCVGHFVCYFKVRGRNCG